LDDKKVVPAVIHKKMMEYYRQYLVVGGMPSVVSRFIQNHDMNEVLENQRDLLQGYKDDFGKHLNDDENEMINRSLLSKIETVFNCIPAKLAKENSKFQYSAIKKSARAREYSTSVQWLVDYGLVDYCFNLRMPQLPLEGNKEEDVFKLYMSDTGLFVAMLEDGTAADILNHRLFQYKGVIYENAIADAFLKNGRKLYYYHKDSGLEIDYVIRYQSKPTLVEVKAKTGDTKAAKTILKNQDIYHVDSLIKLGDYNIGFENNILTLPYYMAFLIKEM
jgi:predicted AAA+ superfamily ATPase